MIFINPYLNANDGGYSPEYQAILNEALNLGFSLPSLPNQVIQNDIVLSLKNSGNWSLIDALYYFKGDGDSGFKRINWKNPTGTKAIENGNDLPLIWDTDGLKGSQQARLFLTHNRVNWTLGNSQASVEVIEASTSIANADLLSVSNLTFITENLNAMQWLGSTGTASRVIANFSGTGVFSLAAISTTSLRAMVNKNIVAETNNSVVNADYTQGTLVLFGRGTNSQWGDAKIGFVILGGLYNVSQVYDNLLGL